MQFISIFYSLVCSLILSSSWHQLDQFHYKISKSLSFPLFDKLQSISIPLLPRCRHISLLYAIHKCLETHSFFFFSNIYIVLMIVIIKILTLLFPGRNFTSFAFSFESQDKILLHTKYIHFNILFIQRIFVKSFVSFHVIRLIIIFFFSFDIFQINLWNLLLVLLLKMYSESFHIVQLIRNEIK